VRQYENLPQKLRESGKFNCWQYEENPNGGKPKKVPYNVLTGGRGDSTNPATFTGFRTALAAVDGYDGLGIGVFGELAVIDIDDCAENGVPTSDMAMDIIEIMDAYTEISPSGTGVRIIVKAEGFVFDKVLYYINNRNIGLEIYIAGFTSKFLTVTGNVIHASGIEERGVQLQAVLDKYMLRPTPLDVSDAEACSYLTDAEVIRKAMNGRNGAAFAKLWSGDISGHDSASEADMALAGQLAFYCGREYEQMERLFSQSALGERGKWTEREDYRRRTLCTAIANSKTTYTPDYCKSAAADDFAESGSESNPRHPASLIKPAVEVQSREVPWEIEGFLIEGAVTGLQGLPDSGKSFLTCTLAVAKANGGEFPKADGTMMTLTPGRVLIANFDDALEFGIKPRLEKLGLTTAGAERISFLDPVAAAGITFDDPRLSAVFEECRPDLAIFDTLQHFIGGKVDLHRANETNAAMAQLKLLAEKYNTAVVIVQYISKNAASGNGGASVLWGLGSTAINGLFRSVWTVGKVKGEDDTLRAAVSSKNNLLPYVPPALQYSLSQERGFEWRGVSREVTARDLIRGDDDKHSRGRPPTQRDEAENFIRETLAFGKVKASEIFSLAEQEGISERTIKRAKPAVGVRTFKEGTEWYWDMQEKNQGGH
jgi:hypothetical protein